MSEWISVNDTLPGNYQSCWIGWAGETDMFEAVFSISKDGYYWSFVSDDEIYHPTHWMPLPAPPEDL